MFASQLKNNELYTNLSVSQRWFCLDNILPPFVILFAVTGPNPQTRDIHFVTSIHNCYTGHGSLRMILYKYYCVKFKKTIFFSRRIAYNGIEIRAEITILLYYFISSDDGIHKQSVYNNNMR